jgi:hypothetical protein
MTLWISFFFMHGVATATRADEPPPSTPRFSKPATANAGNASNRIADADKRLDSLLAAWEQAASQIGRRDFRFQRIRYDNIFQVEWRGTGELAIDVEGRAVYIIVPATIAVGQVSRRRDRNGIPYQLEADYCERWHWTGKTVIQVHENERTFEEVSIPLEPATRQVAKAPKAVEREFHPEPPALPEDDESSFESPNANEITVANDFSQRGAQKALAQTAGADSLAKRPTFGEWFAGVVIGMIVGDALSKVDWSQLIIAYFPLPRELLLEVQADKLKQRYRIELLKEKGSEAWLRFEPRRDEGCFSRATLILNTRDYEPVAIRLIDKTGGEIVYLFSFVQNHLRGNVIPVERLDRPNLSGYRWISNKGQ